jgi:hypothetical protein
MALQAGKRIGRAARSFGEANHAAVRRVPGAYWGRAEAVLRLCITM